MTPDAQRRETVARAPEPMAAPTPGAHSVLTPDVDPTAQATPVAPGAPVPDLRRTSAALAQLRRGSLQVTVLAVLALLYSMYFARQFLIPVVFALVLNFLLSPALRALARLHVPPPLGAAVIVFTLLGLLAGGGYALSGPAQRWIVTAPASVRKAEVKLSRIFRPVKQVQQTAEQVQKAAGAVGGEPPRVQPIVLRETESLASRALGTTERIIVGTLEVLVLLYFLLAGGDLFLQKLIKVLPLVEQKAKVVDVARAIEAAVSAYLTTALVINVCEGIVVGLILWAMGMPSPVLWGVMVACLEFVPYLGAAVATVVLAIAGLTTFDSVGEALAVPASFLVVNLMQAYIVTPLLQGHRLLLNPVAIFVGLTFFWFIWGVPGAFLAVPLLATFKIVCDHVASLAAVGEFLGERDEKERRRLLRDD
jgi:predicted PurR-regulated permease PerM